MMWADMCWIFRKEEGYICQVWLARMMKIGSLEYRGRGCVGMAIWWELKLIKDL